MCVSCVWWLICGVSVLLFATQPSGSDWSLMDGYYLNGQEETDGKSYGFRSVKMVYIEQLELCPVKASQQTHRRAKEIKIFPRSI